MPSANKKPQTLYDKVFQDHVVDEREDGTILLYIGTAPVQNALQRYLHIYSKRQASSTRSYFAGIGLRGTPTPYLTYQGYSKLLKASAMQAERSEDLTVPLLLPIMYAALHYASALTC